MDEAALKDEVRAFLRKEKRPVTRRAIVRGLGLDAHDANRLKQLLQDWAASGEIGEAGRRGYVLEVSLPHIGVVEFERVDDDGDLIGRYVPSQGAPVTVRLSAERASGPRAPGIGDRALCRFFTENDARVSAKVMKLLPRRDLHALGLVEEGRAGLQITPATTRERHALSLPQSDARGAKPGDLVSYALSHDRRHGMRTARVLEVVGSMDAPDAPTTIAIATHGIPVGFSQDEEKEVAALKPITSPRGYEDWTDKPFITIDPEDARDHDDAVFAMADPANEGGWIVHVAIADVAAYVKPRTALDAGARRRGNSVYFPDRVVPMLPERLSTDLCSLVAGENRPSLAVAMKIDADGRKLSHRFHRAWIRLAEGLSYEQAQACFDGTATSGSAALDPVIADLWRAYQSMEKARERRQPLAIRASERRIHLDEEGRVTRIVQRPAMAANKLIEEMMVMANVCAAETLEGKAVPLILRVHDVPSQEKRAALGDFLRSLNIKWAPGERISTARFNRLLDEAEAKGHGEAVNDMVLRSQAQAMYSTENIGHFGLNLSQYAHFTSPIRRYADLTVHRALLRVMKLSNEDAPEIDWLRDTAEHISTTERAAMAAERDAADGYLARFMADRVDERFTARISGVTRAGAFVRLEESGADGLVPMSLLGPERFRHVPARQALVGEQTGGTFRLGMGVEVRLVEATPVSGGLLFAMETRVKGRKGDARAANTPKGRVKRGRRRT